MKKRLRSFDLIISLIASLSAIGFSSLLFFLAKDFWWDNHIKDNQLVTAYLFASVMVLCGVVQAAFLAVFTFVVPLSVRRQWTLFVVMLIHAAIVIFFIFIIATPNGDFSYREWTEDFNVIDPFTGKKIETIPLTYGKLFVAPPLSPLFIWEFFITSALFVAFLLWKVFIMGFANINVQNFRNSFSNFGFFDVTKFEFRKNLPTKILNSQMITNEIELTNEFRVAIREYSHPLLKKLASNKNIKPITHQTANPKSNTRTPKAFPRNSFKGDE